MSNYDSSWRDYVPPTKPIEQRMPPASKRSKAPKADLAPNPLWAHFGLIEPVTEFKFHPTRKWRFDLAWPDQKLAMEVQGGLFVNGRHSRGAALLKEHEKLNAAAALGWRVLFVTPQQMANGEAMQIIESAFKGHA